MERIFLLTAAMVICCQISVSAQDGIILYETEGPEMSFVEKQPDCVDCKTRFHAWIFRRYAGSVEMETKRPYPIGYFGRFTFLPWSPDWVSTPANRVRESQYRNRYHWSPIPDSVPESESSSLNMPVRVSSIKESRAKKPTRNLSPLGESTKVQPLETIEVEKLGSGQ